MRLLPFGFLAISVRLVVSAILVTLLLPACGTATTLPATAPSDAVRSPAATLGLPPTWTAVPTNTKAPTPIPSNTFEPTSTPTRRPSFTPRPTFTSSPTPDLSTPQGVVQTAFAANLRGDEATLESLYDQDARTFCRLTFTTMVNCISAAYDNEGLYTLLDWHVEPDDNTTRTEHVALFFVASHWAESDKVWVQLFSLTDIEGSWKIYESGTIVYPFDS